MKFPVPKFLREKVQSPSDTSAPPSSSKLHPPRPAQEHGENNVNSNGSSSPMAVCKSFSASRKALSFGAIRDTPSAGALEVPPTEEIVIAQESRETLPESELVPLAPLVCYHQQLEEAFGKFDANHDGKISASELGSVLRSLGYESSNDELLSMVEEADRDGDGFIDLQEFILINTAVSDTATEELREAFSVFDANDDGKISSEELHRVLSGLGESCSLEECGRMIQCSDKDGDGFVDFEEFCVMMNVQ